MRWIAMRIYLISETATRKKFFASCEDVTEMQFVNVELPGGYHRCSTDGYYDLRYVSKNFLDMTGYTEAELQTQFDNKYLNMIHPDDRHIVRAIGAALLSHQVPVQEPYRLLRKDGSYMFVTGQAVLTDLYGEVCIMSMISDVTELVKMRNRMQLLSNYSSDCIALFSHQNGLWSYELIVYGLRDKLGMSQEEFGEALKSGVLYTWIDEPYRTHMFQALRDKINSGEAYDFEFTITFPNGRNLSMRIYADRVYDENTHVDYICIFHVL